MQINQHIGIMRNATYIVDIEYVTAVATCRPAAAEASTMRREYMRRRRRQFQPYLLILQLIKYGDKTVRANINRLAAGRSTGRV